jgi:hypothetical protein
MDQEVINTILKEVFPGVLQKYFLEDTIPIVIGGVPLNYCAGDDGIINDIDIKFVHAKDTLDNHTRLLIHKHRMKFIKHVKEVYNDIAVKKNLPRLKVKPLQKQYLWRVTMGYTIDGKFRDIIDTGIIESSAKQLNKYFMVGEKYKRLAFANNEYVVPYNLVNDIPYATCQWIYIDIIRTFYSVLETYNNNSKSTDTFWKKKLLKYIVKYIVISKNSSLKGIHKKITPLLSQMKLSNIPITKFVKAVTGAKEVNDIYNIIQNTKLAWNNLESIYEIINNLLKIHPDISFDLNTLKLKGKGKTSTDTFINTLRQNLKISMPDIIIRKTANKLYVYVKDNTVQRIKLLEIA